MKKSLFFFFSFLIYFLNAQPTIQLTEIASGFTKPVDIAHASDDRLFIVEQRGIIKIIDQNRTVLADPFLDIRDLVNDNASERGLLGLAFHPNYANNGYFFVNYTSGSNSTIARYTVSENNPNVADNASEKVLMTIEQPFANHNGGGLKFGADGFLYIGLGDGGSGGDPRNFSQNLNSLLGKMLRIDVDNGDPYGIPADNPFLNNPDARDEIWAVGLRNPWRFSFDRATNDLWIGDVGQDNWEEISRLAVDNPFGANFGWRCLEGFADFRPSDCNDLNTLIPPVHVYRTKGPDGASVTGGFVYRGTQQPSLVGQYIYGDYVSKKIFSITIDEANNSTNQELLVTNNSISTFGEDAKGELYIAGHQQGRIFQIMDDQTTANEDLAFDHSVRISPNPFTDFIQLEVIEASLSSLQVRVYNPQGLLVAEQLFNTPTSETLQLSQLATGIYLLELQYEGRTFVEKVVKE